MNKDILYTGEYVKVKIEPDHLHSKTTFYICKVADNYQEYDPEKSNTVAVIPIGKNHGFWSFHKNIKKIDINDYPEYMI